ncbi:unnamed protein product [Owenia fusiformis]|uniref:G-protein coupled receptors family 1 profile domain-containing protein n=1 Tax=Owenia fusiformis TaxID=6347 RepID=A0A8S4PLF4_OWEFU|nr:unnamed protein product [Owenia fusiformis]
MEGNWSESTTLSTITNAQAEADDVWSHAAYTTLGLVIALIGIIGMTTNAMVIILFVKNKELRTPSNVHLLSMTISDLAISVFGNPFSASSSLAMRWLFGLTLCHWYGFANTCFGLVSLVTHAMIAVDRYCVICHDIKSTIKRATLMSCLAWLYCIIWSIFPIFGWSSYSPEGPGTWCSVTWERNINNTNSFVVCLFVFTVLIPVGILLFCYARIFNTYRKTIYNVVFESSENTTRSLMKQEWRLVRMTALLVSGYLLAWMPYSVMSLMVVLGQHVSFTGAALPSIFAKTSTCYNPVIYVFLHDKMRKSLVQMLPHGCASRFGGTPPNSSQATPGTSHRRTRHKSAGSIAGTTRT